MFTRCLGEGWEGAQIIIKGHGKFGPAFVKTLSNLCPGIFAYPLMKSVILIFPRRSCLWMNMLLASGLWAEISPGCIKQ